MGRVRRGLLVNEYPGASAGIKDGSGYWNNTAASLKEFQAQGFDVFAGSEVFLLQTLRNGGVGCITATGNVNATAIARLAASWQDKDADEQQAARSEEHTSELQSLMRISYAVFCLHNTISHTIIFIIL